MSINCSLWQENSLSVKRFAFAKFSEVPGECFLLFTLILLMFLVSLTGNALIALVICTNPSLHNPMYFFLANLSLLEIGYTCSVIPKMLQSLVSEAREISREGCATQMFFFTMFYGSASITYLRPKSSHSPGMDKLLALFYTAVTSMLNPIIYSLRNKEVKAALRKTLSLKKPLAINR
ncbi:olfactory receptor 119 isoform 2 [Mus musculus]|uniref:olfactory receptor 119 isoform 2 n=1 Tax=Mus musculus TaxID=10090 RepID=UPI0000215AFD|nr:olfactory receptor 119 isoform 2 [Mus musculus]|eukprot:XP_006524350.1 PREDICTED: olfactory receptor 119 isoform X1 [Mus musculus]